MDVVYILIFIWATKDKPNDAQIGTFAYRNALSCARQEFLLNEGCKTKISQEQYPKCTAMCVSREVEK